MSLLPRLGANTRWLCRCDCGAEKAVAAGNLKAGNVRSCGCLRAELSSARQRTHGESRTRLYGVWKGLVQRCTLPSNKQFANYGGRGISVHAAWTDDYTAFRDYVAALPGYPKGGGRGITLDRIDNDGHYAPGNLRWATAKQQAANRRCQSAPCAAERAVTAARIAELEAENERLRKRVLGV